MTAAAEVAALSLETGIGPNDLLAAPPEVYMALLELVGERRKEQKRRDMRERLRQSIR